MKKEPTKRNKPQSPGTIPAAEFKAKCLEFVSQVRERQVEYVVTRHGVPMAKLVPAEAEPASAAGFLRGTVVAYGDIVSPDPDAWGPAAEDARRNA